jgi:hypothetical protein
MAPNSQLQKWPKYLYDHEGKSKEASKTLFVITLTTVHVREVSRQQLQHISVTEGLYEQTRYILLVLRLQACEVHASRSGSQQSNRCTGCAAGSQRRVACKDRGWRCCKRDGAKGESGRRVASHNDSVTTCRMVTNKGDVTRTDNSPV